MGIYNTLTTVLRCRTCGKAAEVEVQFKYGHLDRRAYSLGDAIEWSANSQANSGRRDASHVVVDAEAVACPLCGEEDRPVYVFIDSGRIARVEEADGRYSFADADAYYLVLDDNGKALQT
jgi:hypothetical protein